MPLDQVCLADVRERQIAGRVHDLDGAGFDPAVAAVSGGVGDRDAAPGQGVEGVEQAGLVVLDRQREVRAAPVHVVHGRALGMQGIGRHDSPVQVQAVQQRDDHRDLIRLGADLGLGCDDARHASHRGQQVHLAAVGVPGAPDGLAVHPDRDQRRIVITALAGARPDSRRRRPAAPAKPRSPRLKRWCQPR